MSDDSRAMRDKWKMVDGDCRDSNEGLITYHVNAFDEGAQATRASSEAEIARLKGELEVKKLSTKFWHEESILVKSKNAELLEQMGMMRKALETRKSADRYCFNYSHLGLEAQENCGDAQQQADELAEQALNATAETVQAYRAECDRKAKVEVLEEAINVVMQQQHQCDAVEELSKMASNLKHDEEQGK
jgi:hypothetical protein